MESYPFMLHLRERKVVVIGGGKVASRKVKMLLATGAHISIVSPSLTTDLMQLVTEKQVTWYKKKFERSDIEEAFIVIAATDNKKVNRNVAFHCQPQQLLNVVSEPELGNFTFPAVAKKGRLTLSVSTSGGSPLFAQKIRNTLVESISNDVIHQLELISQKRKRVIATTENKLEKERLLKQLVKSFQI